MGFDMDCPGHNGQHRLEFWFDNPVDGGRPLTLTQLTNRGVRLYHRLGIDWGHLTIYSQSAHEDPLEVPGHWRGWVVEGTVWDSVRFSRGW
jgi:hypothetical protein